MGDCKKDYSESKPNDMDNYSSTGDKPYSFDNLISRFAPLLISLQPEDIELIKMAYLTALKNKGMIDNDLLADALQISTRTLRNRKNKIISKINSVLGYANGKTFPHSKN